MLAIGGVVAFDDTDMPSLNRLMRYISRYPNYRCLGSRGDRPHSGRLSEMAKAAFRMLTLPLGRRVRSEYINDSVLRPADRIGIDHSLTAFQKTADTPRNWDWYEPF